MVVRLRSSFWLTLVSALAACERSHGDAGTGASSASPQASATPQVSVGSRGSANKLPRARPLQRGDVAIPYDYHPQEQADYLRKSGWQVICKQGEAVTISATALRLTPARNVWADDPNDMSALRVEAPGCKDDDVLALVRGLALGEGRVALGKAEETKIEFGDQTFSLVRSGDDSPWPHEYLEIAHGGVTLRLGTDRRGEVKFVGDLDRDGKLDLILHSNDGETVSRDVYLSSYAESGQFLGLAGSHSHSVC